MTLDENVDRGHMMLGLMRCEDSVLGVASDDVAEVFAIDRIDVLAASAPGVIGAVTVRNVLVPLCDPLVLCSLPARTKPPEIAAIVWDGERMIALAIDGIMGIRRCNLFELQSVAAQGEGEVLSGHIVTKTMTINLVQAARILGLPGMPSAPRRLRGKHRSGSKRTLPHLTFEAGSVTYAVSAAHIQGSVPRREIEDTQLANGVLLGFLNHLSRRLPIVETNAVFGLGGARQSQRPEFVVLQFGSDRRLGLAVDRIRRIEYVAPDDLRPTPARLKEAVPSIQSTFQMQEDGQEAFVLDVEGLRKMPAMQELASLSDREAPEDEDAAAMRNLTGERDIQMERRRYLIFNAGQRFAAPIADIESIITPPDIVTPMAGGSGGVAGLFFVDGRPVPLVALRGWLGGPALDRTDAETRTDEQRVLLIERANERVAFLVDKIDGIALSSWRTTPKARLPGGYDNVLMTIGQKKQLIDCMNFDAMVGSVQTSMVQATGPLLRSG